MKVGPLAKSVEKKPEREQDQREGGAIREHAVPGVGAHALGKTPTKNGEKTLALVTQGVSHRQ